MEHECRPTLETLAMAKGNRTHNLGKKHLTPYYYVIIKVLIISLLKLLTLLCFAIKIHYFVCLNEAFRCLSPTVPTLNILFGSISRTGTTRQLDCVASMENSHEVSFPRTQRRVTSSGIEPATSKHSITSPTFNQQGCAISKSISNTTCRFGLASIENQTLFNSFLVIY